MNWKQKTNLLNNLTYVFTYDNINQLTKVVQGSTTKEQYTYDRVGNRLTANYGGVGNWNYNNANQLTSRPNNTYTYDANGNTKTLVTSAGTTTYNWDFENRLTSVVLPGSGGTMSYAYDPFGRRIQKVSPTATRNYIYDGANAIEDLDQNGRVAHLSADGSRFRPNQKMNWGVGGWPSLAADGS